MLGGNYFHPASPIDFHPASQRKTQLFYLTLWNTPRVHIILSLILKQSRNAGRYSWLKPPKTNIRLLTGKRWPLSVSRHDGCWAEFHAASLSEGWWRRMWKFGGTQIDWPGVTILFVTSICCHVNVYHPTQLNVYTSNLQTETKRCSGRTGVSIE